MLAATFIWEGGAGNTGLTLTATIRSALYVSVASGLTGIQEIGATGTYRWYYAEFADDLFGFVEFLSGATVKKVFSVAPAVLLSPDDWSPERAALLDHLNADITSRADASSYTSTRAAKIDQLDAAVSSRLAAGSYTGPPTAASVADAVWDEGSADHVAANSTGRKLSLLGAGQVTVSAPVASGGRVTIIRGDDYLNVDGRSLEWIDTDDDWPVLTGATVTFLVGVAGAVFTKAAAVVTATGSNKKVRVELTTVNTTAIPRGNHAFVLRAVLADLSIVTLVQAMLFSRNPA